MTQGADGHNKVVVFGATGFTGRLVTRSLVDRGVRPVVAGRSPGALRELAADLGGLEIHEADAERPETLASAVGAGDVLVTTVGPFARYGDTALQVAVDAGAHYVDSTGEPPFIRRVFQEVGPRAEGRCALLTAFGYDYVPGNLAGALALREAGDRAVRLAVGYFYSGPPSADALSSGTIASIAGIAADDNHAYRDGRLVLERFGTRSATFEVDGDRKQALSVGGSEHLELPSVAADLAPGLTDIEVAVGWFGPFSPVVRAGTALLDAAQALPGIGSTLQGLSRRLSQRTGEGPDEQSRSRTGSRIVAEAFDARDEVVARVQVEGPNAYALTGDLMAWAAQELVTRGPSETGGIGPVRAFGLDRLVAGCEDVGLVRVRSRLS